MPTDILLILYDLEPTQRYEAVLSAIDRDKLFHVVIKKSSHGAPVKLNYSAMINAWVIRIIERIPTIKDLIR